ncbi:MAG: prolipoprotein diacylglyceryl transferase [Bacilli bacterium]
MSPIMFTIGNFSIKWYAFLILIGAIVGIIMIMKEGKRFGFSKDFLFNLTFWVIIMGIIGARIFYVIFNPELYTNFFDIFKIWEGGLAIYGGIIFGILTIIIYCKRYKVRTIKILDFFVPALFFAQALGRWGNFFNSEAHGAATSLLHLQNLHIPEFIIDGMRIGGLYYEPTFFYESLWCLLGLIIVLIIRRLKFTKVGVPTAFYFMWYGVGRFFIEAMRTDSLMLGGFKVAQIISIIIFLVGLGSIMVISRKARFEDLYDKEVDQTIRF